MKIRWLVWSRFGISEARGFEWLWVVWFVTLSRMPSGPLANLETCRVCRLQINGSKSESTIVSLCGFSPPVNLKREKLDQMRPVHVQIQGAQLLVCLTFYSLIDRRPFHWQQRLNIF